MSSRVEAAIKAAHEAGRGAFIGYLPAGFPDIAASVTAAVTLVQNGADIIELGPPYTDPVMDGPIIQAATEVALAAGFRTRDLFEVIRQISAQVDAPIVVMTYWNLVVQYGIENYARDIAAAGGAGLVTPDITPENADEWIAAAEKYDLDRIFLAAPTSSDERLRQLVQASRGFVYAVSTMGITGERADLDVAARTLVGRLREAGGATVCVGIGISTADQIHDVVSYADGAIVGSALVRALGSGGVAQLASVASDLATGTAR